MTILTIDFETYYDTQFSLSKITTEEYIRSPAFETIGVSVKVDDQPARWFSGTHRETKVWLDQFPWTTSGAIAHNAVFDMAILNWVYNIRPKRIIDTLSMARALHKTEVGGSLKVLAEHYGVGVKGDEVINALGKRRKDFSPEALERYGQYCMNDVELTYLLAQAMTPRLPLSELKLIDTTIRMFTEPKLVLDVDVLEDHLRDVKSKKDALLSKALIDKDNLMSNPKLAETLRAFGIDPPMKVSPTTGKETYAFAKSDEAFIALLEHENPLVQAIVAARLGVKSTLEETRTERFLGIAQRGTLPVPLRYYAALTGRWGGDDSLNLQNLPRVSPLKKAIRAPDGYVFIDCDSSQIEARVLAWLANQNDLVAAFDAGEDVYKIMASSIYGVDIKDITKDQRFVGKWTILGSGYGMGAAKYQTQLKAAGVTDLTPEDCQYIIDVYRNTYARIPMLWKQAQNALQVMIDNASTTLGRDDLLAVDGADGIILPNGLRLTYPNLRWVEYEDRREMVYDTKKGRATIQTRMYGGKLVEHICQALARIIIGEQTNLINARYPVVMTVHDAVGVLAPAHEAEEAQAFVEACMRKRPSWAPDLPLNCESKMGPSYGG